jgi:putative FmdB family regulatory protein
MPIYEYRCGACGQQHEVLQKASERPLTKCPACGKPKLQKLLSAAGFQLKGSGWYATDFKGGGKKPAEKKSEEKKTEAKTETKTEAKAETKPDAKPASTTTTTD